MNFGFENLEDEFWSAVRENFQWNMYPPDKSTEYVINVFDDGNEKYEKYDNTWYKYGDWKGKVALINKSNYLVTIGSISSHKIFQKD